MLSCNSIENSLIIKLIKRAFLQMINLNNEQEKA